MRPRSCTETALRRAKVVFAMLAAALSGAGPTAGWTVAGHAMVARSAIQALPPSVPEFFRLGGDAVAHAAVDPDLFRVRDAPALRHGEGPEHYLDLEYLGGEKPRERRYEYLQQLESLDLDPARVGFLAQAVNEGVERLAVVFAEHRRFPDDPLVRSKALYLAGLLAHYAADLCQPLHTTIHYDGRAAEGKGSPATGIHRRIDGLFGTAGVQPSVARGVTVESRKPLFDAIVSEIEASHALVDRVYRLEPLLPLDGREPPPAVRRFAEERYRASVAWLASLFLTAWEKSAELELPSWAVGQRRGSRRR